jgi:hypothetical protein
MSSLISDLASQLSSNTVSKIAEQLGVDSDVAQKAVGAALPALISGLSMAAEDPKKGAQLANVVNEHEAHEGSLLDHLMDIFNRVAHGSTGSEQKPDLTQVLPEILGDHTKRVERSVSHTSGLSMDMVQRLMKYLAPVLVGVIAKQMSGKHVDAESVNKHLGQEQAQIEQSWGKAMVGRLFDQDNDGDFDLSDIANVVMKQMT